MITRIVIHCSDSPDDMEVTATDIHDWHIQKGWSGIGYHYVICRDGTVENGRPHYWEGAHVAGYNAGSIGICLIGRSEFTSEQFQSLKSVIYLLKFKYQDAEILGHNELDHQKSCPNFDLHSFLKNEMPGISHTVRH